MAEAYFNIRVHLYNADDPPTAVQLYGGPIGTIVSMTIYENDIDETCGVLPKGLPLASLLASPAEFHALCDALNAGGTCTLCISYEIDEDKKRQVNSIWVQAQVLLAIERGVDRTANTTEEIYEVLNTNLKKVVTELTKTNQILLERLPDGGGKSPNGGPSTSPPPLDDDCEEPTHHA
jgi:hypothetical protein